MRVEIYSDVICPWCYIGKRRLERALEMRPEIDLDIEWKAFQLNPTMPSEGMDRRAYLMAKFGDPNGSTMYEHITAIGYAEEIDFRFDEIPRTPNTVHAHRLIRRAVQTGDQNRIVQRLFDAYFNESKDIGDLAVLASEAAAIGWDLDDTSAYLASNAGFDDVVREDSQARQMGIQGVPCFIFNGEYVISGAQEPEYFMPLFDLLLNDERMQA